MMRRTLPWILSAAFLTAPLAADDKLGHKIERSREVFVELLDAPDRKIPRELLDDAECIAIIPAVIKGALGWGGRHGRGVLSCRHHGDWSPPTFVKLTGASFGLQIGAESTDFVLFLMTRHSIESLLESKFVLGGGVSVAAGPLGRSAELGTDAKLNAEIYAYARSRGLFAGASLEGSRLAPDQKANRRYYGRRIWPEDILFGRKVQQVPAEVRVLQKALP